MIGRGGTQLMQMVRVVVVTHNGPGNLSTSHVGGDMWVGAGDVGEEAGMREGAVNSRGGGTERGGGRSALASST